jgi:hypothetical protein
MSTKQASDIISLSSTFSHCRHGIEVRDVSAKEGPDGWVVWGHYACPQCDKIALLVTSSRPQAVTLSDRMLPVL